MGGDDYGRAGGTAPGVQAKDGGDYCEGEADERVAMTRHGKAMILATISERKGFVQCTSEQAERPWVDRTVARVRVKR